MRYIVKPTAKGWAVVGLTRGTFIRSFKAEAEAIAFCAALNS
jgi:hypothetical protein